MDIGHPGAACAIIWSESDLFLNQIREKNGCSSRSGSKIIICRPSRMWIVEPPSVWATQYQSWWESGLEPADGGWLTSAKPRLCLRVSPPSDHRSTGEAVIFRRHVWRQWNYLSPSKSTRWVRGEPLGVGVGVEEGALLNTLNLSLGYLVNLQLNIHILVLLTISSIFFGTACFELSWQCLISAP